MKRALLHLFLFLGTCFTTWWSYWCFEHGTKSEGVVFAAVTLSILGAHEMGHYVMARLHGVASSLPYFLPVPIGFGTFGAVIRIRGRIPTRDALVDIGAAGPLAGLAVAIPVLIFGLIHATTTLCTAASSGRAPRARRRRTSAASTRSAAWATRATTPSTSASATWHVLRVDPRAERRQRARDGLREVR